jgi:hypothetical protein
MRYLWIRTRPWLLLALLAVAPPAAAQTAAPTP